MIGLVRKYVPIKAPPKFLRALSKTSFSTSLETMDLSPRTYLNRYSLSLGPKARMSIDATEITYIKQIGGGNFGQVYLAVSSHKESYGDVPNHLITLVFYAEMASD